jgi:NAD+ synthase (glutamine-hydrolysing)
MKISIAQLNPIVGDIPGNIYKLKEALFKSDKENTDLIVFPELFITGYPPKDLLLQPGFLKKIEEGIKGIQDISKKYPEIGIIFGAPIQKDANLYNSAVMIYNGKVHTQNKMLLPSYDVFDEKRYFEPSSSYEIINFKNEKIGLSICEDAWVNQGVLSGQNYNDLNPIKILAEKGATLLINISASPFRAEIDTIRYKLFKEHAKENNLPMIFVNQVGGNDDLIFDGKSMIFGADGNLITICNSFLEEVKTIDLETPVLAKYEPEIKIESIYNALCLGLKDYMAKCGFTKAIVGLSGGIDSAIVSCLAAAAIGPENILSVSMPSVYSSEGSVEDSRELAQNLGINFQVVPIANLFDEYLKSFNNAFNEDGSSLTEENIQARIRGNILMAFSNQYGHLLLSTGNKSEMAVGYCTLYGDLCGGLSVLSDIPKTVVYELADYINRNEKIIPEIIITKAPSAELRPDQKDQDSLPPYEVLDKILYLLIEEKESEATIINKGFDPNIVKWVLDTIRKTEYKRYQAPPGFKITGRAFGQGRKMPLAAKIS